MDDPRFNVIFNEDFDDDYDNEMNHVVDHINYPSYEGSGASVADAGDDNDGNNNNDDSNDDEEFFLRRQFDMNKLIICTARAINMYYINYMHKKRCMVSYNTRMHWLNEVLRGH
jgi:hypothetical protein